LEPELNEVGIVINPSGPAQHAPVIERKNRVVKERVRAIIHSLPFQLPPSLTKYAVNFAVARVNSGPSHLRVDAISPREAFLKRKLNSKIYVDIMQYKLVTKNFVQIIKH
jgi:hypothetical protein